MDNLENDGLKRAVEGLLFASERPLTADEMRQAFEENLAEADIRAAIESLKNEYESQNRGFRIFEIAGGYQLVTDSSLESHLKKFYQSRLKKRLSQATLETLSVIAYRQPVTRADIEFIRGVAVDGALKTLLEKGIVKIAGRKEVPGRPMLYATTPQFLEHFGINTLQDLPPLNEYTEKDLDPALLPPQMRAAEVTMEEENTGEQKPVGCANEPDDESTPGVESPEREGENS